MTINQNIGMTRTVFLMAKGSSSDFRSEDGPQCKAAIPLRSQIPPGGGRPHPGTTCREHVTGFCAATLLQTLCLLRRTEFQVSPTFANTRYQLPSRVPLPSRVFASFHHPPATFWLWSHLNSNPAQSRLVMRNQDGAFTGILHACGKIQEATRKI